MSLGIFFFFFAITVIETNSLQLQQSEMSTYLNDFNSSFPEKEHKSKSHLLKKNNTLHLELNASLQPFAACFLCFTP